MICLNEIESHFTRGICDICNSRTHTVILGLAFICMSCLPRIALEVIERNILENSGTRKVVGPMWPQMFWGDLKTDLEGSNGTVESGVARVTGEGGPRSK